MIMLCAVQRRNMSTVIYRISVSKTRGEMKFHVDEILMICRN